MIILSNVWLLKIAILDIALLDRSNRLRDKKWILNMMRTPGLIQQLAG